MADKDELTVIVKGTNNKLAAGAKVSVEPGGSKAVTASNGEATVKIGSQPRYDVTVVLGSETQTQPFYARPDGSRRIEFNMPYLKAHATTTTIAAKESESSSLGDMVVPAALSAVLLLAIILVFVFARKHRSNKNS